MNKNGSASTKIESFIENWSQDEQLMRKWFVLIYDKIKNMTDVELDFVERPGVSYSIRPKHVSQIDRSLFAIIDVIDDDPDQRWLSICFYEDMITDPNNKGEVIPGGLAGDDGYCFDMFENDQQLGEYLLARLDEAAVSSAK